MFQFNKKINFLFFIIVLVVFITKFSTANTSFDKNSKTPAKVNYQEDPLLDEFDDTDFEEMKNKSSPPSRKKEPLYQKVNKGNIYTVSNLINQEDKKSLSLDGTQGYSNNLVSSNKISSSEHILEEIKTILTYGTYHEQSKIFTRIGKDCKKKTDSSIVPTDVVSILEKENFFIEPFEKDEKFVLAVLDMVHYCHLVEKKEFINKILVDEYRYRNYSINSKNLMKTKAWETLKDFFQDLQESDRTNYAKLADKYYRYQRYHNQSREIKKAVVEAAGKFQPENFNKLLEQEYPKENDIDLKNAIIETIGLYKDFTDIDFLDDVIKEEEASRSHRWVAVVAFTNYASNSTALEKVKEYTQMAESAIVSRAYYVLSFYDLDLDFFIEAAKNNDENIRLQAIQAMSHFPFEQIKDILEYKSTKDISELVRKRAKKILEEKKDNP